MVTQNNNKIVKEKSKPYYYYYYYYYRWISIKIKKNINNDIKWDDVLYLCIN